MECGVCGSGNAPEAIFCTQCGTGLERRCPECGTPAAAAARFCGACGHRLAGDAPARTGAAEPEPAGGREASLPPGERRHATVLFSDLSGYTALGEHVDPEELHRVMERIRQDTQVIVERHGGTYNQFRGDEVMALFGIPTGHEDDPVRAVRAAVEIHRRVREIGGEVEARLGRPLRMHSGINSGLLVSHRLDDRSGRYSLAGDAVNTAARLTALAQTDEVVIGPAAEPLVAREFDLEAMEPVRVKNKAEPVRPFRVLWRNRPARGRIAGGRRRFGPMVDRRDALATLHDCLERAFAGQGRFVAITGGEGLGKSRLVYEFRGQLSRKWLTLVHQRCRSEWREVPFAPLIELLRRRLRLHALASPQAQAERLLAGVRRIDADLERYVPFYLRLLSLPAEGYPVPEHLQGDELREAIEEALVAFLVVRSLRKPQVLVVEDCDWADEATASVLARLQRTIAQYPVMIAVVHRSERLFDWERAALLTRISLGPLEPADSAEMAATCLGAASVPAVWARRIHERTGGVPFFVEEICRELRNQGLVRIDDGTARLARSLDEVNLPHSVHALVQAQVDRLEPEARRVLQCAALVGRDFDGETLRAIVDEPHGLTRAIETLKAADLVHQVNLVPRAEYMFRHVIVRDIVYEGMLRHDRRALHARVARALEALEADDPRRRADHLAYHYAHAEQYEQAVPHGRQSARRAYTLGRASMAAERFGQVDGWLQRLPEGAGRTRQRIDLRFDWFPALIQLGRLDAAAELCAFVADAAHELGDPALLGQADRLRGVLHLYSDQQAEARSRFESALERLGSAVQGLPRAYLRMTVGLAYNGEGRWRAAEPHLADALRLMEAEGAESRYFEGSTTLPYVTTSVQLAFNLAVQGRLDDAHTRYRAMVAPGPDAAANLLTRAVAAVWASRLVALTGEDNGLGVGARVRSLEALVDAADAPFLSYYYEFARMVLAFGQGNHAAAAALGERCLELAGSLSRPVFVKHIHYYRTLALLGIGDGRAAAAAFDEGYARVSNGTPWDRARYDYLGGRLLLEGPAPDLDGAHAALTDSIAADEAEGAVVPAAHTRYVLARLHALQDDRQAAAALLANLEVQYRGWGLPAWVHRVRHAREAVAG